MTELTTDKKETDVRTPDDSLKSNDPAAIRRRAVSDLLHFAKLNDLEACEEIVKVHKFDLADQSQCCDYDQRTPLHLAASGGAYRVTEWLLHHHADVNAMDNFQQTPLDDALKAGNGEVADLLADHGGRMCVNGQLVPPGMALKLAIRSGRSKDGGGLEQPQKPVVSLPPEWEIDRKALSRGRKLGEGEFGVVYEADWIGTPVAAKELKVHNITLGDLRTEVSVLRRVHHPNVVQFLGACVDRAPFVLVTELMYGGSLQDALDAGINYSVRRALELGLDTARGMAYLHDIQPSAVIHRDLKPQNLMLAGSPAMEFEEMVKYYGSVKIADFGLSKTLPFKRPSITAADTGKEAAEKLKQQSMQTDFELTGQTGSYRYMAPEVMAHKPYGSKADVYSFAMVQYQLLFRVKPLHMYDALRAAKLAAFHQHRPQLPAIDPKTLTPEQTEGYSMLVKLLQRCWAHKPADRPAFPEIIQELKLIISKLPPDEPPKRVRRTSTPHPGSPMRTDSPSPADSANTAKPQEPEREGRHHLLHRYRGSDGKTDQNCVLM